MQICNSVRISVTFTVNGSQTEVNDYQKVLAKLYAGCSVVARYLERSKTGMIGVEGKREEVVQLMAYHQRATAGSTAAA